MSAAKAAKARTRRAIRREVARHRANEARRARAVEQPATPSRDDLPAATYAEAAKYLRRPFTPEAVKFKVQAANTDDGWAMVVYYIDARLAVERLNLVCPEAWSPQYARDGSLLWCHLSVFGITRPDIGDGYIGKGLVSDALKRAAVQFGVGVSLYAVPKVFLKLSDGHIKPNRKEKYTITPSGEAVCRALYRAWLDDHGVKAFGDALDHGDVEGAIGDAEVEAADAGTEVAAREHRATVAAPAPPSAPSTPPPLPQREELTDADHEKAIAALLAVDDPLAGLRKKAHEGMTFLAAPARQRHEELAKNTTREALEGLLLAVTRALETSPDA